MILAGINLKGSHWVLSSYLGVPCDGLPTTLRGLFVCFHLGPRPHRGRQVLHAYSRVGTVVNLKQIEIGPFCAGT